MIKAIFFDFDGVLTIHGSGSYTTCTNIQKHVPDVPIGQILKCYRVHQSKLLLGQTTHADVWKDFCACIGKDLDIEVLHEAFRNTPMNVDIMELCKKLKGRYRLGIITDNSKERIDLLKDEMKLSSIFDVIVVSGETGVRKDSDATFMQALALAKCCAEECVFIDNNESNLTAPKKLGWNTIFYDDKKNDVHSLIEELDGFGVDRRLSSFFS
jgi:putative hydrolase of the HAD superfamily